jgi:poly-D-alanine transfer protein DltD
MRFFMIRATKKGEKPEPYAKSRKACEDITAELASPYFTELQLLLAKFTKARYTAFVREGFTPEQALFLCK